MIKRNNSHLTSRSTHQMLAKNSFSINDSISSINQTKKLRNKKSYKEIYLDKMGITTSISVSRKNYSLLTKSLNDSDYKEMIYKSSRNTSSNNNEVKTPKKNNSNNSFVLDASLSIRGKRGVESFASPRNKNIHNVKKNIHNKNVNKKKKLNVDEKNKHINHNIKEKNKTNNKINNKVNNNINKNKENINKIEKLLDNNLSSDNYSSSDKSNDSFNSLFKSQNIKKNQFKNKSPSKNKKITIDEFENDVSPSLKGILLNKNSDTIRLLGRFQKRSKTVNFYVNSENDKVSSNDLENKNEYIGKINRSKTLKVEKNTMLKKIENMSNQIKKMYVKFGLLENNKINNKNIKENQNNNQNNSQINKLKDNKTKENINKLKENNNKNEDNNLLSGKIILTDEKGNIINQNDSYDFQNTKKSEGKFSIISNESPNKNNNIKTESNEESLNNSKNDNKKFEDEEEDLGEERVRAFDEFTNKKEKNVDTINELDEEYESDFTNQRIKNTLKKSNLNTLESLKNKKKDNLNNDKIKINNFDDITSPILDNNKLFETQSDFFNQNYSPLILSLEKKNIATKNIEIMNPNVMNNFLKCEKKKNQSNEFDKINSFVKMMRNKNNKKILSYTEKYDKENFDETKYRTIERELYNEKRKQKMEKIKNILTESNDIIDEEEKNYKIKRSTFRNLVKLTNSLSTIRSSSKDLKPIKNQKKLFINHSKKNSYSFKNDLNNNNNYNNYYNYNRKNRYYNNNYNTNNYNYNNNNYNYNNSNIPIENEDNDNSNIKYLYSNKTKSNDILFPLSYEQYYQYFGNKNNNLNELDNNKNENKNFHKKNNNTFFNTDENFYNINKYNNVKTIPKINSYIEKRKIIKRPFEKCKIMPANPMDDVLIAKENCIYEINNL